MLSNMFSHFSSLMNCVGARKARHSVTPSSVPTFNYVSHWEANGSPIAYPSPAYIPTFRHGMIIEDTTYISRSTSGTTSAVIDLRSGVLEEDGTITYDEDQDFVIDSNRRGFSALKGAHTANQSGFLTSSYLSAPLAAYSQTRPRRGLYDDSTVTTHGKVQEEATSSSNESDAVKQNLRKSRQFVDHGHYSFEDVESQRYVGPRDNSHLFPRPLKADHHVNLPAIVLPCHDKTISGVPEEPGLGHPMSLVSEGDVINAYSDGNPGDNTTSNGTDQPGDLDMVGSVDRTLRRVNKDRYSLESQREAAISAVRQVQAELAGLKNDDYDYSYPKDSVRARHKLLYSNISLLSPVEEVNDDVAEQMS